MPNLDKIYELIEKRVIMMKEVPVMILILKIYEINYILKPRICENFILLCKIISRIAIWNTVIVYYI